MHFCMGPPITDVVSLCAIRSKVNGKIDLKEKDAVEIRTNVRIVGLPTSLSIYKYRCKVY